jgi:hypothetical protein
MRVKTSCDGNGRFKARLIGKGYVQKQGITLHYIHIYFTDPPFVPIKMNMKQVKYT